MLPGCTGGAISHTVPNGIKVQGPRLPFARLSTCIVAELMRAWCVSTEFGSIMEMCIPVARAYSLLGFSVVRINVGVVAQ